MIQAFAGWDILVGKANGGKVDFADQAIDLPHQHTDQYGNTINIDFVLDSMSIGAIYSTASFHYDRLNQGERVKIFRKSYINIRTGSTDFFRGQIIGQRMSHGRVIFSAVGVSNLVNNLPILGVLRKNSLLAPTQNTFSVFNEQGKADFQVGTFGTDDRNDNEIGVDAFVWANRDVVSHLLTVLGLQINKINNGLSYFDFDASRLEVFSKIGQLKAEDNLSVPVGILDELDFTAKEDGKLAVVVNKNISTENAGTGTMNIGSEIKIFDRFDFAKRKNITYDSVNALAAGQTDGLPFSINVTHDFSSPTSLIMYSGQRYVQTILEFDPNNTLHIEEIKTDSETKIILFYDGKATGNFIDSAVPWAEIFGSNKAGTFTSIDPRIENYDELVAGKGSIAPQMINNFEVFFKFKTGTFDTSYSDKDKTFLQDSPIWLEGIQHHGLTLSHIDKLNINLANNEFELSITGFNTETDGKFTIEEFKARVEKIFIPVTIEVDSRVVVESFRLNDKGTGFAGMFVAVDNTKKVYNELASVLDMSRSSEKMIIDNSLRPLQRSGALKTYEDGVITTVNDEQLFVETFKKIVNKRLSEMVFNDGVSMSMSIPNEIYHNLLSSNFPKNIGDWLDDIEDSAGSVFAGYEMPRPMMLISQGFTNTTTTLNFQ